MAFTTLLACSVALVALLFTGCLAPPPNNPTVACLNEARNATSPCQTFHSCCETKCGGENFTVSCSEEQANLNGTCKCKSSQIQPWRVVCGKPAVPPKVPKPGRIVGGEESNANSWPWQASLQSDGEHFCGGSLIDNIHILTAAHCVDGQTASDIKIKLGMHDQRAPSSSYKTFNVAKIMAHAQYDPQIIRNDIAIIRLATEVQFSANITPICLPSEEAVGGQVCMTTGWGRTKGTGDNRKLLQVAVPIVAREECNDTDHHDGGVDETMICAGQTGKGVCHGDSGGPLVCQRADKVWELQGATSWGNPDCTEDNKPGVYNRVFAFKSWVMQQVLPPPSSSS